jgi:hypothetical protein
MAGRLGDAEFDWQWCAGQIISRDVRLLSQNRSVLNEPASASASRYIPSCDISDSHFASKLQIYYPDANLLLARNFSPYFQNSIGAGNAAIATNPKMLLPHP